MAFLKPYRDRLTQVRVDANGIGYNFALNLRDEKFRVEFVHVGLRVQSWPGPDDPSLRFFNLRAQYYLWLLKTSSARTETRGSCRGAPTRWTSNQESGAATVT